MLVFLKQHLSFSVKSCESTMNSGTLKFGLISKFKLLLTFSTTLGPEVFSRAQRTEMFCYMQT